MLFDSHAHLLSLDNYKEIINNMQTDGLAFIINASTTLEDSWEGLSLASSQTNVYTIIGLYPEYAELWNDDYEKQFREMATNQKVVGIGEIGLDYHGETFNREKQIEVFEKQIKIAYDNNLPICIHCRNAAKDMYDVLQKNKYIFKCGVLMHCYSEDMEYTQKFKELGCYFSFSGNITYKKADTERVGFIGIDKLLIETDCPYLAPVPVRGTRNIPANVKYTAQKLADILQMSQDKFLKKIESNARGFFKKIK